MNREISLGTVQATISVPENLKSFEIRTMPSSHVVFYGLNPEKQFFVQVKGKKAFVYNDISDAHIIEIINCDSIGKVFANTIKHNYNGLETFDLVNFVPIGTGVLKEDVTGRTKVPNGRAGEIVKILAEGPDVLFVMNDKEERYVSASRKVMRKI